MTRSGGAYPKARSGRCPPGLEQPRRNLDLQLKARFLVSQLEERQTPGTTHKRQHNEELQPHVRAPTALTHRDSSFASHLPG